MSLPIFMIMSPFITLKLTIGDYMIANKSSEHVQIGGFIMYVAHFLAIKETLVFNFLFTINYLL
jgi:hypothetical protein